MPGSIEAYCDLVGGQAMGLGSTCYLCPGPIQGLQLA